MLWSQNFYQQFSGKMHSALEISYQLMQLAEDLKNGALIMEAHQSIGALLVLLGRPTEALEHIEKGSALYAAHHHHRYSVFGNFDSKVMFECFAGLALLDLGYPDQSAARLATALALARELGHPQTLVTALHVVAQCHQLQGEASLVYDLAKEALDLADEYGFAVWRAYGLIEVGWAEAELGNAKNGIEKMQQGFAEYEATGAKLRSPYFMGLLADQLRKTGRVQEGLAVVTDAITLAQNTGEGYGASDLHVIKGELLWKSDVPTAGHPPNDPSGISVLTQARACFEEALRIAEQQGARWRQLRAALKLAYLDVECGESARTYLPEIYSSFTEGHETAEFKQAKALLGLVR
jgi:predicted ATPase